MHAWDVCVCARCCSPVVACSRPAPFCPSTLTTPRHSNRMNATMPRQDRRALEYTVYDKELKQAREELTRAEEARLREIERCG